MSSPETINAAEALAVQLDIAKSVSHDLIDTVIALKTENKLLIDRVDSNVQSAQQIIAEQQRQIDGLTNECTVRDSRIADLEARIPTQDYEAKTEHLNNEISALHGMLQQRREEIESHTSTIRSLKEELRAMSAKEAEAVSRIDHLTRELEEMTKARDSLVESNAFFQKNNADLTGQVLRLKDAIETPPPSPTTTYRRPRSRPL